MGLLSVRDVDAEPRSDEARRRLCFFANSLFMELPPAPAVPSMHSFSVMTPFYSEGEFTPYFQHTFCDDFQASSSLI